MLEFDDLKFEEIGDLLRISIYSHFYTDIEKIDYKNKKNHKKILNLIRSKKRDLTYKLNGNKAIFIDEDSTLPLIGLQFLGIVDKGSEIIELKPITNCNADCSFCSVDEGPSSKKEIEFIVDKDYLVSQLNSLLNELLSPSEIAKHGFFETKQVNRLIHEHQTNIRDHSFRIWALVMFQIWYQTFMEKHHEI